MKQKFADALRTYQKEVYKVEHDPDELQKLTSDALHFAEETLDNAYHYHFHKLPDASRAEIINMINNYTREAILPPVVEKLVERQVLLEKHLDAMDRFLENMLEVLSRDKQQTAAAG